ncbi:MAG: hypothetical protein WD382_08290 [Halofilum sp. (in: g-proteobacteria)]
MLEGIAGTEDRVASVERHTGLHHLIELLQLAPVQTGWQALAPQGAIGAGTPRPKIQHPLTRSTAHVRNPFAKKPAIQRALDGDD